MDQIYKKLKGKLNTVTKDVVLAPFTTFKIGGPAKYFFIAKNNEDIVKSVKISREIGLNFFILGGGSNILVSDKGFDGLVIKIQNSQISIKANIVNAESGSLLQKLIQFTLKNKFSGLEHLVGIPGTVGGGIAGNVGTPDKWIDHNLIDVDFLNSEGDLEKVTKSQCDFSYRFSRFKYNTQDIILSARWELTPSSDKNLNSSVKKFLESRGKQPVNYPCAGSIFKNPPGEKAWQLVEKIGLRGKQIGGAKISDEHSNFIINVNNATAEDVVILISFVKQQVRDNLGIQLQEEIKYIGF